MNLLKQTWQKLSLMPMVLFFATFTFAIDTETEGYRINTGTNRDINAHNICRNVNNTSGANHFVSTGNVADWQSFIDDPPTGLAVSACTIDPDFSEVVLLIQPTVSDTVVYDLSNSGHPISLVGNATLSTAIADPWGGSRQVIFIADSDSCMTATDSNDWSYGTGAVTLEMWAYSTGDISDHNDHFFSQWETDNDHSRLYYNNSADNGMRYQVRSGGSNAIVNEVGSDFTISGSWYHIAYTRSGNTHRMFVDGTQVRSWSDTSSNQNFASPLHMGCRHLGGGAGVLNGYIGAVRITKGVARYTTNFTPDTEPWTSPDDYIPDAMTWSDFNNYSTVETLTGLNKPIDVELAVANVSGTPTIQYSLSGGAWTDLTAGSPTDIVMAPGQTLQFRATGTDTHSADITITDQTNSTVLDTVRGTAADDPHWANVVLLIQPGTGDTSPVDLTDRHTVSESGDVTLTTAISDPTGGNNKVITFDGSGDYLTMPDSNDWFFDTGDVTIELWAYHTGLTGSTGQRQYFSQYQSADRFYRLRVNNSGNEGHGFLNWNSSATISFNQGSDFTTNNSWVHIAYTREGNNHRIFVDGNQVASTTDTSSIIDVNGPFTIGRYGGGGGEFVGHMGAFRVTKGVARYTSNFTPDRYFYYVETVTPNTINWADFLDESSTETFTGINTAIDVELSVVHNSGAPTVQYRKNAGSWTSFAPGSPATVSINNNDDLQFRLTGAENQQATITVINKSDGDAVLDTLQGSIPMTFAYSYTGVQSTIEVPTGTTLMKVKAWGAGGGGGGGGTGGGDIGGDGGGGGFAQATFTVTPTESLTVDVGGAGQYGVPSAGGGGGGFTGIKRTSTVLIAAGSGGGGGGSENSNPGGDGGAGGSDTGAAGGSVAATTGGTGGTQGTGGTGGSGTVNGAVGSSQTGGDGGNYNSGLGNGGSGGAPSGGSGGGSTSTSYGAGGGGGSGYYGGGGGGSAVANAAGGGGGGGSGYVAGGDTTNTAGSGQSVANSGDADYPGGGIGQGGTGGGPTNIGSSGGHGHLIAYFVAPADYSVSAMDWPNFDFQSIKLAFSGITRPVNVEISASYVSGTPSLEYQKNSESWVNFTPSAAGNVSFSAGDTLQFRVTGTGAESADISVTNTSDGSALIDTTRGTVVSDPHWSNVVLLIQPEGSDTTPVDMSPSGHAVYPGGDAALSTTIADPRGGSDPAMTLDGSGDFFVLSDSNDWDIGNDYTVEAWVYHTTSDLGNEQARYFEHFLSDFHRTSFSLDNQNNLGLRSLGILGATQIDVNQGSDASITRHSWHHVAFVKNGSNFYQFVDGVLEHSATDTDPYADQNTFLYLGRDMEGYIGSMRVTKDVARYTSGFTPEAYFPWEPDWTPNPMDWANFNTFSDIQIFTGINQTISIELSVTYGTGTPTVEYGLLSGATGAFTPGSPVTIDVNPGDYLAFSVDGNFQDSATITVTNLTDSSTLLDTVTGTVQDPYWDNVVLLIQPTASDTIPIDLSNSAHVITEVGNAALTTTVSDPWGGSRKVASFDGSGDYLSIPDSNDWLYDGDFTIEFWVNLDAIDPNSQIGFYSQYESATDRAEIQVLNVIDQGLDLYLEVGDTAVIDGGGASDTGITQSNWHHVAFVRQGNDFTSYVDGNSEWTLNDSSPWDNLNAAIHLGVSNTTRFMDGHFGEFRITKGVARYTANFTPPTQAFFINQDYTPAAIAMSDFFSQSEQLTLTGFNQTINLEFSATYTSGVPTLEYRKNGGSWTSFTSVTPANEIFASGDNLEFRVSGTPGESADIAITNTSDGNTVLDTVNGEVAITLTEVTSARVIYTTNSVTISNNAAAGDFAILTNFANETGSGSVSDVGDPVGWTLLDEVLDDDHKMKVWYRTLTGGDPGSTISGLLDRDDEGGFLMIFRPSHPIGTVNSATSGTVASSSNPAPISIGVSSASAVPILAVGYHASENNGFINLESTSGSMTSITDRSNAISFQIFNNALPGSDLTIDMTDGGDENGLIGGYFELEP